jgi:hypothetical protein
LSDEEKPAKGRTDQNDFHISIKGHTRKSSSGARFIGDPMKRLVGYLLILQEQA